jgi:electron-transferring-flavoprotein dehydrogenase
MDVERESLDIDVLFVGAGPASLSGALHLATLISAHNEQHPEAPMPVSIAVIEKGKEVGAHSLSGAVLDPTALKELIPDYEQKEAPLSAPVRKDHVWFLTEKYKLAAPVIPPPLRNHGNYIISLGQFVKWLAAQAEKAGVDIFPEFPAVALLTDGDRVIGVQTGDKGVDKHGNPKPNFEPGVNIFTKMVVLGEGVRGSLTKSLVSKFELDKGKNPQVYSVGIKELWEIPTGRLEPGTVIHTLGYPLDTHTFGGGFIYAMSETMLSLGLVVGLSYEDPRLDPHVQFQKFKSHPAIAPLLKSGQLIRYGAKALPEGGYYSLPRLYVDGLLIVGDSAGFLNSQRLKGIHLAMKSGMLAAETMFDALLKEDFSSRQLSRFETLVRQSWIESELYKVRNFHQSFHHGLWFGLANGALQMITGGRGLQDPMPTQPGHTRLKQLRVLPGTNGRPLSGFEFDGEVTFDKLTDVYYSRTAHVEDQPVHLLVRDYDICHHRCTVEYGNPCQFFCPANVYEMVEAGKGSQRLQINASNCVHCKTCDIMDPYGIITWVPPEGGGGPDWHKM